MTEQSIKTGEAIPEQLPGREHIKDCKCGQCPEQPNQNLITFEQIEGCCDIIEKLLKELVPKTEQVESCIITHKSWRGNNLKHLRKAFE